MKNLKSVFSLVLFSFFWGDAFAQILQTPWQVHDGGDIINFSTSGTDQAAKVKAIKSAFAKAEIPPEDDKGWKSPQVNQDGKIEYVFKHLGACATKVDFVYFQTTVTIDETKLNTFTVSYQNANDAARIYFYAEGSKTGEFNEAADLIFKVSANQTVNLKDKVKRGKNRVVIVAFNLCNEGEVRGIEMKVNGEEIKKVEPEKVTVCGNTYETVTIGKQTWMAENLKGGGDSCGCNLLFTDGSLPPGDVGKFFYDGKPRYAYYDNKRNYGGAIYNFAAIDKCDVCPVGYRLPTAQDFRDLLASQDGDGKKLLKGKGSSGWGGETIGRIDGWGSVMQGSFGEWWTDDEDPANATNAFAFVLTNRGTSSISSEPRQLGCYVRCIKIKSEEVKALTPVALLAEEFRINAFSIGGQGQASGSPWFIGYLNTEKKIGRIVNKDNANATILSIEKITVEMAEGLGK